MTLPQNPLCVLTPTTLKLGPFVLVAPAQWLWGRAQTLGSLLFLGSFGRPLRRALPRSA